MADGQADKILLRSGFESKKGNLQQSEPAFLTDSRKLAIGDGSPNPPTIPTTKSVGVINLSSADKYIFHGIEVDSINGIDIDKFTDIIDGINGSGQNIIYDQLANGVHVTVKSATTANPPSVPNAKDVYLVPNNPGGAWLGKAGLLAQKLGTDWVFTDAPVKTIVGVADTGTLLVKQSTGWENFFATVEEHLNHTSTDKAAHPAGVYALIQSIIGGGENGEVTPVKYTVSPTPPPNPNIKDYWWDSTRKVLCVWGDIGNAFNWIVVSGGGNGTVINGVASNADYLLPISWSYATENFSFETWTDDVRYNWRDFGTIAVTNATAGDDSLDLASTAGLKQGESYLIQSNGGDFLQAVEILSILSPTRVRLRTDLNIDVTASDGATLARSSFDIGDRFAQVKNNDRMYTSFLTTLGADRRGYFVIRRTALGTGVFSVSYRYAGTSGSANWTDAALVKNVAIGKEYRDEFYEIPAGGNIQFQINYKNTNTSFKETIFHMGLTPRTQAVDANRIYKPVNVAPADQATGVSKTPTLTGSLYRSIYGLTQNGAEFRIASDAKFTNIVVSSSTDFLASWVNQSGPTADARALVFLNNRKVVVVGLSGNIRISNDGGKTYPTTTTGVSGAVNGICYDSARVHIVAGALPYYSDDQAASFSAATTTDGFAGTLNAISNCPGGIIIAVGSNAEILRSTNNGQIYQKVAPDAAYAGTFTDIATDSYGNVIVCGTGGEIQTSSNRGSTFTKRTNAGNFNGAFNTVSMDDNGNAVVAGANGMIQVSSDRGATWTVVAADNSYSGTFYGSYYTNDYGILVGSSGEIQTTKNKGRSWVHRTNGNGSTGIFRAAAITPDNYALIVGDGGLTQYPLTLQAATSWTVPAGSDFLKDNGLYYWQHRYQDSAGFWSEWSDATLFVTTKANVNSIKQPINLAPADNYDNASLTPTLQSSAFSYSGDPDTHVASQWQVSTDPIFTTTNYDSGETSAALLTLLVPAPLTVGKFYWRVRHKGANAGWSSWSTVTSFRTNAKPNTPTVTQPANNSTLSPNSSFTLASTAFSSPVPGDTLALTNFDVAEDITFNKTLLKVSVADVQKLITPDMLNLGSNKNFYVRAQQKGNSSVDFSDFSPTVIFRTRAASPFGESVYIGPEPRLSAYDNRNTALYVDYDFQVPADVYSISVVLVGAGSGPLSPNNQGEDTTPPYWGGAGGGLTYKNNIPVTPGQIIRIRLPRAGMYGNYSIVNYNNPRDPAYISMYVDALNNASAGVASFGDIISATSGAWALADRVTDPGNSSVTRGSNLVAINGKGGSGYGGDGGGNGGLPGGGDVIYGSGGLYYYSGGPGGAGGYAGNGGQGGPKWPGRNVLGGPNGTYDNGDTVNKGQDGAGGAGGGGGIGAGGVGLSGQSNNGLGSGQYAGTGAARKFLTAGQDGSFDKVRYVDNYNGWAFPDSPTQTGLLSIGNGGRWVNTSFYSYQLAGHGGRSACRIIWGDNRAFPSSAA